jgi:hypothetical protein
MFECRKQDDSEKYILNATGESYEIECFNTLHISLMSLSALFCTALTSFTFLSINNFYETQMLASTRTARIDSVLDLTQFFCKIILVLLFLIFNVSHFFPLQIDRQENQVTLS